MEVLFLAQHIGIIVVVPLAVQEVSLELGGWVENYTKEELRKVQLEDDIVGFTLKESGHEGYFLGGRLGLWTEGIRKIIERGASRRGWKDWEENCCGRNLGFGQDFWDGGKSG